MKFEELPTMKRIDLSLHKEFGDFISQGKDLTDVLDWIVEKIKYDRIKLNDFVPFDELEAWAISEGFQGK